MNKLYSIIISLCFIVVLPMTVVNVLLTHFFVTVEYAMPWFPSDEFGFSDTERYEYAIATVDALKSPTIQQDLATIGANSGKPIYIQREIDHLVDVKVVIDALNRIYYAALALFLLMIGVLTWKQDHSGLRIAFWQGALLMILCLLGLGAYASIDFFQFFTWFHSLFFKGDTWLFRLDDSLIRLFPIRFWMDAVVFILGSTFLVSLGLLLKLKPSNAVGVSTK